MRVDRVLAPLEALSAMLSSRYASKYSGIHGDVFMDLVSTDGRREEHREIRNLIVKDASVLIARLMKDNREPKNGVYCLAVGSGNWTDLQQPPAATNTQRSLYAEIARKAFTATRFVDSAGMPSTAPTNVVDFSTTFSESEAVGALVEMALLGGDVSSSMTERNVVTPSNGAYNPGLDLRGLDTQINYTTFKVLNKPATSTLSITWRLTF